ncbi:MAG: hypothetical protein KDA44_22015 [Planctomycetales bacterium]|nr:hypothetical protein [Planctomycetales bacterium]
MKRLSTFIIGMLVGGALLWMALNYHLIRARDGLHLVGKTSATLANTYVDVRNFRPADWVKHPEVTDAILSSKNQALIDSATNGTIDGVLDRVLPRAGAGADR